jgi:hypothetical protein
MDKLRPGKAFRWKVEDRRLGRSGSVMWQVGTSKPSSLPSTDAWLKPTALMAVLGEKLRWVPWATQPGWEVESGALFLESSSIHPTLLMTHEMLLYADHVRDVWSRAIREPSVRCVWHVDRVSPTGCTSIRIAATFRYEWPLVRDNLHVAN